MRNVIGHQCKVKMSGSEKNLNENTYDISSKKRVTNKFLEVSRCGRVKQRQRNVQKKCAAGAPSALPSWLSIQGHPTAIFEKISVRKTI